MKQKKNLVVRLRSLIAAVTIGLGLIPSSFADVTLPATITRRGDIKNAESVFENKQAGTVAFLGGSITEGKGYSAKVMQYLRVKYPQCAFTEINAGISSTCSDTGAFRVQEDILSKRKVDLFFVEFAVNDDQDGHFTEEHARRGMEGIVRQVREANPACDIVMIHFVNPGELATIQAGGTPIPYAAHESVAAQYGVPTVNIGAELARLVAAGTWTWEKYGVDGNGHPTTEGGQMAADKICELLTAEWTGGVRANTVDHTLPAMLDPMSYSKGGHIPLENAVLGTGWNLSLPNWASIDGNKRDRYTADPILWSETPGSEFTLTFTGTAVGAFVTSYCWDVGALDVSVDGGAFVTRRLISTWSYSLHYPMTVMLADDLTYGEHTLRVKLVEDHKDAYGVEQANRSNGRVARIHALCVNGVVPEPPAPASNVKFVALADNLATAIANAAAGDELRLEKGTFTVASTISSSKALTISGGWTNITTQDPEAVTTLNGGTTPTSTTANGLLGFTAGEGTINLSKLVFTRSWASGFKHEGNAWLVVTDCQFRDNGQFTTGNGNNGYPGLGAYVSGSSATTEASFTRCVFEDNVTRLENSPFYTMHGAGLFAQNLKSLTLNQTDFLYNGTLHTIAHEQSKIPGREAMHGFALYANNAPTTAKGCRFFGNRGAAHDGTGKSGSVVYLTGTSGGSSFKNCLWAGNVATTWAGGYWGAGAGALVVNLGTGPRGVEVTNCTIAFNAIEGNTSSSAGLNIVKGAVTMRDSIIWGNYGTYENSTICPRCVSVQADGTLDVDYSIIEGGKDNAAFVRAASNTLTWGTHMKDEDPLFATPANFVTANLGFGNGTTATRFFYFKDTTDFSQLDLHVKSPYGRYTGVEWVSVDTEKSPAIDAGDPSAEYANEPPSNGERVNMGFYGNTAEASKSESVEPTEPTPNSWTTLASITKNSWTVGDDPGVVTPPVAQYNDNFKAVTISKDGAAATTWDNVMPTEAGQYTITWTVPATTEYTGLEGTSVSFTISAPEPPDDPEPVVTGTFVPLTKSLADAIREASDGDELHLQTGTFNVSSTITSSKALTISGGWTNATTQDPGAVTTLDGGMASGTSEGLLKFTAGSGTTELSKLVFTRSWTSGLKKEGNANLVVTDCQFIDNGYYTTTGNSGYQGLGAYVSGSSSSTEVSFTRCVFSNNVTRATAPYSNMQGAGLYASGLKSLTLDQTDFLFNGMPHSFARDGTVTGRESMHGFALYAENAPTTATGCRFIGNCGAAHSDNSGSVVYLKNGSGGSSFKNCLWTGNLGACYAGGNWSSVSGALVVSLNSNTAAVSVENCTMAFNAIEGKDASAGLTVDKGTVTLRSSIIWGNYATQETANNNVSAQCVAVHANGSLNADYSIFEASDGIYVRSSGTLALGKNMKYVDPQFAAPSTFMDSYLYFRNGPTSNKRQFYFRDTVDFSLLDLHVKSTTGRYNAGEWVVDDVMSEAIDAGDPDAEYANEPNPKGECVNMGCYGNTAEASKSVSVGPEPNSWTTDPAIDKDQWILDEGEAPGKITVPVAAHNDDLKKAKIAKDGGTEEDWDDEMPTEAGSYEITWTVPATDEYAGLTAKVSFTILATRPKYVKVGMDWTWDPWQDRSSFTQSASAEVGWRAEEAGAVDQNHVVSSDCDYIVPTGANLSTGGGSVENMTFEGHKLILQEGGKLVALRDGGAQTVTVGHLVAQGGEICGRASDSVFKTFAGNFDLSEGDLGISCDQGMRIAVTATVTGDHDIFLVGSNDNYAPYQLQLTGDMSQWTGTMRKADGSQFIDRDYTLTVSGQFGGSLTSIPKVATQGSYVAFNYDNLVDGATKGLKIEVVNGEVDETVKNNVVLYSSTVSQFTQKSLPIMTFPAGANVRAEEFTVRYAQTADGPKTAFTHLWLRPNADGTKTLVANSRGLMLIFGSCAKSSAQ